MNNNISKIKELLEAGKLEEADSALSEALQSDPSSQDLLNLQAEVSLKLGTDFWEKGDADKALDYFIKALELNPSDRTIVLKCGEILTSLEQPDAASNLYQSYLQNNPDEEIAAALKNLGKLAKPADSFLEEKQPSIRVSAIVSTFNSERFMRGCLEDLVNQTLYQKGELEIIVIDSGSEQNEKAIVEEFQKTYQKIVYIRTERETVYAAWNRGIKLASAKYITNANTDDRHRKDALEVMAGKLDDNPDVGLVYADVIITATENETFDRHTPIGAYRWLDYSRELLTLGCFMGPQPMWRKDLHEQYGYFDESFTSSGDWEFWLRIAAGTQMLHVPEFLGLYLYTPQSAEHRNPEQRIKEDEQVRNKYARKYLASIEDIDRGLAFIRQMEQKLGNGGQFEGYRNAFLQLKHHIAATTTVSSEPDRIISRESLFQPLTSQKPDAYSDQGPRVTEQKKPVSQLVSIIVLLSGDRAIARRRVEGVQKTLTTTHEIIFIPPNSSYAPPKWLRRMIKENKNYRLVTPPDSSSKGFSSAVNAGIAACSGEYIVLLDDAVLVTDGWLDGLIEALERSDDVGIVGPLIVGGEGPQGVDIRIIETYKDSSRLIETENKGTSHGEIAAGSAPAMTQGKDVIARRPEGTTWQSHSKQRDRHDPPAAGLAMTDNTPANDKQSATRIFESSNPEVINQYVRSFRERNRHRQIPVKALYSSCFAMKRKVYETVGAFDERFLTRVYAVEDYCLRSSMEGHRSIIAGDVLVGIHKQTDTTPSNTQIFRDKRSYIGKWSTPLKASINVDKLAISNILTASHDFAQKGENGKALEVLIEGLQRSPDDERLHFRLAEFLLELHKYRDADDVLKNMPETLRQNRRWFELAADCAVGLQSYSDADALVEHLLTLDEHSANALNLKGMTIYQRGNYIEAARLFEKAVERDPGFAEAYANLGGLKWALKDFESAFDLLERAFILSPASEGIALNYHSAAVAMSRQERASTLFGEAAALYPLSRRLKYMLADLLLQQERHHEAMDVIEKALLAFGMDDDSLTLASALREKIGPHSKGPRGKGGKGESYDEIATGSALAMTQGKDVIARSSERTTKQSHTEQRDRHSRSEFGIAMTDNTPAVRNDTISDPTLSICMIVKNEEKHIGNCLHKIKPLADEIIVVDTGSTDRTKEIAKIFGAKVYDFAWTNSFSDARNYSLSKATGDWILVLDADETIAPSDFGKIRELIENGPRIQGVKGSSLSEIATPAPGGFAMTDKKNVIARSPVERGTTRQSHSDKTYVTQSHSLKESQRVSSFKMAYSIVSRNYVVPLNTTGWVTNDGTYLDLESGTGWSPSKKVRLFPNDRRIYFEEPVHELVENSLNAAGIPIIDCDVPVHHYGKLDMTKVVEKGVQYYELGKAKFRGENDVLAIYELATQAGELGRFEDALHHWKKLVALVPDYAKGFYGLGYSHYRLNQFQEAFSAFKKSVALAPDDVEWRDAAVLLSHAAIGAGRPKDSIEFLKQLLSKDPEYPMALLLLCVVYACSGEHEKGSKYLEQLEKLNFDATPYLAYFAELNLSQNRVMPALALLNLARKLGTMPAQISALIAECDRRKVETDQQETHRDTSRHVETTEEGIKDSRGQVSKNKVQGAEELRKDEIATTVIGGITMTDKEVFARDDKQNESERSPRPDNLRDSR